MSIDWLLNRSQRTPGDNFSKIKLNNCRLFFFALLSFFCPARQQEGYFTQLRISERKSNQICKKQTDRLLSYLFTDIDFDLTHSSFPALWLWTSCCPHPPPLKPSRPIHRSTWPTHRSSSRPTSAPTHLRRSPRIETNVCFPWPRCRLRDRRGG